MSPRFVVPLVLLLLAAGASAQQRWPLSIRGQRQDVRYYPASSTPSHGTILFLPGDGGWRGFAVNMAEAAASWGYDVYGFDTKRYLTSFTSGQRTLTADDVMSDLGMVAVKIRRQDSGKVLVAGWSEGAGLGVLAVSRQQNKEIFGGLVAIGLPESAVLGWRLADDMTYITKRMPNEPTFSILPYLPKISPLPLVMIQSRGDEYTALPDVKKMFEAAGEPKRFFLVDARSHRFDGDQEGFFRALREGLQWINRTVQ